MKLKLIVVLMMMFFVGCASSPELKKEKDVLGEVFSILPVPFIADSSREIIVVEFHSHGLIGDLLAVGAMGGANARDLRNTLEGISTSKNSAIIIMGSGTGLDKTTIGYAVDGYKFPRVRMFFVGKPEQEEVIGRIVRSAGMEYNFINIYK